MNNNKQTTRGKIIIEFQPEGEIGEPYGGSISIQMKATLSKSDQVMALHALASSFSDNNSVEALGLLHTARKLALHTCITGESWCDVYEQMSDGTLIDKRVLEALSKKGKGDN